MQRALERKIRKAIREYLSLDAAGQDTAESAVKLRQARAQLNDFLTETGLQQDNFRKQVADFGRSAASKATALAKKQNSAILKQITGARITEPESEAANLHAASWINTTWEALNLLILRQTLQWHNRGNG